MLGITTTAFATVSGIHSAKKPNQVHSRTPYCVDLQIVVVDPHPEDSHQRVSNRMRGRRIEWRLREIDTIEKHVGRLAPVVCPMVDKPIVIVEVMGANT